MTDQAEDGTTQSKPRLVDKILGSMNGLARTKKMLLRVALMSDDGEKMCEGNPDIQSLVRAFKRLRTDQEKGAVFRRLTESLAQDGVTSGAPQQSGGTPDEKAMSSLAGAKDLMDRRVIGNQPFRMYHEDVAVVLQKWERVVFLNYVQGACIFGEIDGEEDEGEGEGEAAVKIIKRRVLLAPNTTIMWKIEPDVPLKKALGKNYYSGTLWKDIHKCLYFLDWIWRWWDCMSATTQRELSTYILRTHAITLAMISRVDRGLRWEKFNSNVLLVLPDIVLRGEAMRPYTENMTCAFETARRYTGYFAQFGYKEPEWLQACIDDADRIRAWQEEQLKRRQEMIAEKQRLQEEQRMAFLAEQARMREEMMTVHMRELEEDEEEGELVTVVEAEEDEGEVVTAVEAKDDTVSVVEGED